MRKPRKMEKKRMRDVRTTRDFQLLGKNGEICVYDE